MKKRAAVLFTGGKDSCLALYKAKQHSFQIKYLLSILPSSYDSWMWHKPSLALLKAQARTIKIPLITQKSVTEKEQEIKDLEELLKKIKDVNYIVTGAVASTYQRQRIEQTAKKFYLKTYNPLWKMQGVELWKEALHNKFEIILTKICCEGIPKEWLGKPIDLRRFEEFLKLSKCYGFELTAEGGDFETAVLDMPLFEHKIEIEYRIRSESPYRHFLIIKKVKLKEK